MWQAGGEKRGEQGEECTVDEERKMRGRRGSGEAALSMQPSTCNVSQYSHIFHFMCDLLGFY